MKTLAKLFLVIALATSAAIADDGHSGSGGFTCEEGHSGSGGIVCPGHSGSGGFAGDGHSGSGGFAEGADSEEGSESYLELFFDLFY